ncbi:MAG TPA: D-2-hydroxyacid dehydrogenase [Burkholderiales bacterium]|nr:D-2-hydroxyacid dehydrogenase [Burkholderiales bacterium]
MTGILLSRQTAAAHRDALAAAARESGIEIRLVHLPEDPQARLDSGEAAAIEIAFLTRDLRFSGHYAAFAETVGASPNLKWLHFVSTAIDPQPFLPDLVRRKVRLTTSAGSNGEPVAQTAIGGMLMLARNFPHWWAAQGRREWAPLRGAAIPRDLHGQAVLIVGLGTIGATVARFCQALGMHVIGVRRRPRQPGDPVNEMHTLAALPDLLPRCDWVVLACPFTPETRRILHAGTLERLRRGARLINVARGGVVDETAVIAALRSGRLGGAYLDVYEQEPLPADSPLWDLPNVILSPHNASASSGNNDRAMKIFLANLARWGRGEPLLNEEPAG